VELNVFYLTPEIILLASACIVTLLGLSPSDTVRRGAQVIAALACLLGLAATLIMHRLDVAYHTAGSTQAAIGFTARYFNPSYITGLACAMGFLLVLVSWDMPARGEPASTDKHYRGEYFGMMLFSLTGVAMMGKVNDLVWLFIALELVSIPTYIMVATGRGQIIAQEAGIKYFFLGALAAAVFLFGFSYIYGATGATRFSDIRAAFGYTYAHPELTAINSPLALIGILTVIVGVSYKIAAVPLHFYAPDVYQGAATPVTAYLAFAPKAAGMIAIIAMLSLFNFNYQAAYGYDVMLLLSVMAALTMTVGNVLALLQRNVKRMLAYSSIAHSGYMLVGLAAGPGDSSVSHDGILATLFYLAAYAVMNTGAFAVLVYLQGKADAAEDLDDLAGIAREHRGPAIMLALCLLSLIGMPFTIGFYSKLYIINAALFSGRYALAVITAINAAIAAAYYLKIIASMYLREPLYPFALRSSIPIRAAGILCTAAVIALFFVPSLLMFPAWGTNAVDAFHTTPPASPTRTEAPRPPAALSSAPLPPAAQVAGADAR
jgi:NADH-quinone oxidoreductase subunit N